MDYFEVHFWLNGSPSFVALRKEWVPLAVSFLYREFKERHRVSIPQDELIEQLHYYLDSLNETMDKPFSQTATQYITRWANEDGLLFIRVNQFDNQYQVLLSPEADRLIGWFEDMQARPIIGTESRFMTIYQTLRDIVGKSSEDAATRLVQLYNERDKIDVQIHRIESTGYVDSYTDIQLKERVFQIEDMARKMLRDFTSIESRFQEMALTIQQAQLNPSARKGTILEGHLNAEEELRNSDESQSFYAFWRFLTHPDQKDEFNVLLNQLFDNERLAKLVAGNVFLRNLTSFLLEASERIVQTDRRLAQHLRRMLDERSLSKSQQARELIKDIKYRAMHINSLPDLTDFMSLEVEPLINLIMHRPLWEPSEEIDYEYPPEYAPRVNSLEVFSTLYTQFFVDETELNNHIQYLLTNRSEVTLAELANSYPIQKGMTEILVYLNIAHRNKWHQIDLATLDEIALEGGQVLVPRIIFKREV